MGLLRKAVDLRNLEPRPVQPRDRVCLGSTDIQGSRQKMISKRWIILLGVRFLAIAVNSA